MIRVFLLQTVTADGAIDVADIVEYFQGLEMLAALKAELVEGIKHCATKQVIRVL